LNVYVIDSFDYVVETQVCVCIDVLHAFEKKRTGQEEEGESEEKRMKKDRLDATL